MNDPRVVALHYRIEHESSVDYSKAEPVDHEEEGFRIRIEEGRACFLMKDDHPTVDSALGVVNSYISNWELDDALTSKPGEFKLRFVRPEIVDRKPIPGEHKVFAGPVFWEFSTSIPTVTKGRPYPKPPIGVSLKRNDDVLLMLGRYEDLCKEREKLPSVAQFCLTILEKLAGGRPRHGRRQLRSLRLRKRCSIKSEHLPAKRVAPPWPERPKASMRSSLRWRLDFSNVLSRCLFGEWLRRHNPPVDRSERSPERTFQRCDRGTNKDAPECSTTYLYSL